MKEKIYTIPLNDAFDEASEKGGCPFCSLKKKTEQQRVSYTLGASMMEPEERIVTNALGFCAHHYEMLFKEPNKLSLALVLDTHIKSVIDKYSALRPDAGEKKGFFKKKDVSGKTLVKAGIDSIISGCAICKKVDETMERYIDVFFYMWSSDREFRQKFDKSSGVCLPHMSLLLEKSNMYLKDKECEKFVSELYEKQSVLISSLHEDIHKFTLKFDYRNKDMEWGSAKDAPMRAIEYLSGANLLRKEDE